MPAEYAIQYLAELDTNRGQVLIEGVNRHQSF